jgi:hypothetical protein
MKRLDHPTRRDLEAELAQQAGNLGRWQPQPLGQPRRQRDRPRADLHPSHAQRSGGLLGMARLNPPPAAAAAANLEVVAGNHRRARRRQVFLILAGHPFHLQLVAAVRADCRQPHTDHPVDPLGDRPAGVATVGRTGLAPRPPGTGRGSVVGEWRCLALGRPPQLLDLAGQLAHAGLELLVGVLQPVDLVTERSVLAFQPPKLLVQLARAADPRIAPSVPQPPRHRREPYDTTAAINHPLTQYISTLPGPWAREEVRTRAWRA